MPALVALDVPAGPRFVDALRAVWDTGDAAAPLDPRLPPAAARKLMDALSPGFIMNTDLKRTAISGSAPVEAGDALVVATSGSTGAPRGVVLTHDAIEASARASSAALGVDPTTDTWLACLPLAHIGGLSVVTRAILTDTPLILHERFAAAAVDAAVDQGATLVSLVATALLRIRAERFRRILLGGAAAPEGLPENVLTTYGMTETASGVVYDGRPLQGVDIAIRTIAGASIDDEDAGTGVGEILLRGPMLLRAYRDGTDPRVTNGWLPTGDAGYLDADGRLHVIGRIGDVIVTGGEKVWPAAVEQALARHQAVEAVAVAGRPDPEWGQRVVAFVVPVDPTSPPGLDELRETVRGSMAPWAAPKELVLLESLPRTPNGKLSRTDLPA